MAGKKGRPTDCPKDNMIKLRIDEGLLERLDAYSKAMHKSRSEVIRESVELRISRQDEDQNRME